MQVNRKKLIEKIETIIGNFTFNSSLYMICRFCYKLSKFYKVSHKNIIDIVITELLKEYDDSLIGVEINQPPFFRNVERPMTIGKFTSNLRDTFNRYKELEERRKSCGTFFC